jgi:CubicO group peptidase (beta-lactamase class C family)
MNNSIFKITFPLWILIMSNAQWANSQQVESNTKRIDQLMSELLVPGVAIGKIENGNIVEMTYSGYQDISSGKKINDSSIFNIGSISKTITTLGVLHLVQNYALNMDLSVNEYLKSWKIPSNDFKSDAITIRMLLSHTSGLNVHGYRGVSTIDSCGSIVNCLEGKFSPDEKVELINKPGSKWSYSGGGFSILQLLISDVSGISFEKYMEDFILSPLNLKSSTFRQKELTNFCKEYNGLLQEIPKEHFSATSAAGFSMNLPDLMKVLAFLMNDQQNVLNIDVLSMRSYVKASKNQYGLGLQIFPKNAEVPETIGHSGANMGWRTILKFDPVSKRGIVIMTNGENGHLLYDKIICDWENDHYNLKQKVQCPIAVNPQLIKTYTDFGIDSTIQFYNYHFLQKPSYYSFNPGVLLDISFDCLQEENYNDALTFAMTNENYYPTIFWNEFLIAKSYEGLGDKEKALHHYKVAYSRSKKHIETKEKIKELEAELLKNCN